MSVSAVARPPALQRIPSPILLAIAAAWVAAVTAEATGIAASFHHDSLLQGGPAFGLALLLFLLSWQVMTAAMMLPSSLPLVRLFSAAIMIRFAAPTANITSISAQQQPTQNSPCRAPSAKPPPTPRR